MAENGDLNRFERLTDPEKAAIAPELALRAATLYGLVRHGMVRQPQDDAERELANRLAEMFPGVYVVIE